MTTDDEFLDIANQIVAEESDQLLESQLAKVLEWRQRRFADNKTANLRDLIAQVTSEPNKRHHVLAAYCAAMWRILQQRGELPEWT